MPGSGSTPRIEKVVTSGIFSLDGEDHEVDNNIWLYGDDAPAIASWSSRGLGHSTAQAIHGRRCARLSRSGAPSVTAISLSMVHADPIVPTPASMHTASTQRRNRRDP